MQHNSLHSRGITMIVIVIVSLMLVAPKVQAQQSKTLQASIGITWQGDPGITMKVSDILQKQSDLENAGLLPHIKNQFVNDEHPLTRKLQPNPLSPAVSSYSATGVSQNQEEVNAPGKQYVLGLSFDALNHNDVTQGWTPPDPMVAAGPTQLVVTVNGVIRVFDKLGTMQFNFNADVFFQPVRNNSSVVDPRVRYDATSNRWFISAINETTPNRIVLAVSSGSTISGSSSFTLFQFTQDKVGPIPNPDTNGFADYETLGVDANAVYFGSNIFYVGPTHTSVFVVKKSDLFVNTLTVTAFRNIGVNGGPGMWTPQPALNNDPASTEGYFVGVDQSVSGRLIIRRISTPGGIPSISGDLIVNGPTTAMPLDVPQKGTTATLDAIDDRLYTANIRVNTSTGTPSLWCSHNILVDKNGVGTSTGNRDGVRWYEINNLTTTPTLNQSGTLFDANQTTGQPRYYWMGTIAMNDKGQAVISCTTSSKKTFPNAAYAQHVSGSALGKTTPPKITTNNTTAASFDGRWGDYSSVSVDPSDGLTMWLAHEWTNSSGVYTIRIDQLVPPPAPQRDLAVITGTLHAKLYPNPTSSSLNISFDGDYTGTVNMQLMDIYGRVISSKWIDASNATTHTEDVQSLAAGSYLVVLKTNGNANRQSLLFVKN